MESHPTHHPSRTQSLEEVVDELEEAVTDEHGTDELPGNVEEREKTQLQNSEQSQEAEQEPPD